MARIGGQNKVEVKTKVEVEAQPEGDDRPARYVRDDGVVVYRPSSLASCDRALVACARGEVREPWSQEFQEILDEGTRMEGQIVEMFLDQYVEVSEVDGRQETIELEVMDGVVLFGHIDGWFLDLNDQKVLFEAKKVRPSGWEAFKRQGVEWQHHYPMQVATYMYGLGVDRCAFVGGLYDKDKDEIKDIYVHWLDAPPVPLKGIVKRVRGLEKLINLGFAASEVDCEKKDYPCPYYKLHDDDGEGGDDGWGGSGDEFVQLDGDHKREWDALVTMFTVEDRAIKELDKKKLMHKANKDKKVEEMRAFLEAKGYGKAKKVKGTGSAVSRVKYETKEYVVKAGTVDYFQLAKERQ